MGRSTDSTSVCLFRLLVLLGLFFPPAASLDPKNIRIRAGPDQDFAQRVDPGPCETRVHELAVGIAAEVRDLVVTARELQVYTEGEAQPFAGRLLAIAARIAARLDQHHGALAAVVAPEVTASLANWNATRERWKEDTLPPLLLERPNATPTGTPLLPCLASGRVEGEPEPRRGPQAEDDRWNGMEWDGSPQGKKDDRWGILSPEGGSDRTTNWDHFEDEGFGSYVFAIVFVGIVASAPIVPHLRQGGVRPTKVHCCESFCLFAWLFSGLYLFTHVIIFQSPHFEHNRTLRLEESVYLISQIVTTVGYGDITPAEFPGQFIVGFYVFFAVFLISKLIGDLVSIFQDAMEDTLLDDVDEASVKTHQDKLWAAFVPVLQSGGVFLLFMLVGATFFYVYPGEGKTLGQAIYMSMITLSTVGFGSFTPVSRGGMVFAAYWMLFGVGSLAALVSARIAFTSALIHYEKEKDSEELTGKRASRPPSGDLEESAMAT